jgi:hypothetical protein
MALSLESKETIKSGTIWLYSFGKSLRHKGLISDQDFQLYLARLRSIENCTNLESTYNLKPGRKGP